MRNEYEPSPSQLDELVKQGFGMIGNKGDIMFRISWDSEKLHNWLRGLLPVPFERLDILWDEDNYPYPWRLLQENHGWLKLQSQVPQGYDFVNAKSAKGKPWQDGKLYVGK